MKIAFIAEEYVTEHHFDGGLANYLYRVALSLKDFGHEPYIIIGSMLYKNEQFLHNGIPVVRIKIPKLPRILKKYLFLWKSWFISQKLKKLHLRYGFDIIQYTNCNNIGFFRLKDVPCVIRFSCSSKLWDEAYEEKINHLIDKFETKSIKKADAYFGPSYVIGKELEEKTDIKPEIIETPFILDEEEKDYTITHQHLNNKKYLLFFGRLGLLKGTITIADMLKEFFNQHPDYYFVFIGNDYGYKGGKVVNYIKQRADNYQDKVIYFDKLPHNKLYPIIENAECVVLPSRIDNFPNTCIEAMAHNKIVIGTRGTSFEQLIDDGENGFLCQKNSPDDLLKTIEKVLNLDKTLKTQIEQNAFDRIKELRPEKVVNQLIDFYNKVIQLYHLK